MTDYTRVGTDGTDGVDRRAVELLLEPHVAAILKLIHYSDVVAAGQEWVLPLELDCGFDGTILVRIDDVGACERSPLSPTPLRNGGHR